MCFEVNKPAEFIIQQFSERKRLVVSNRQIRAIFVVKLLRVTQSQNAGQFLGNFRLALKVKTIEFVIYSCLR